MHRRSVWLTAGFVVSLSVACSARGGGGNIGPLDSGSDDDATVAPVDHGAPDDTTVAPDLGFPPVDTGFEPVDTGKAPVDTGLVVDNGPPPACGDARCNGTETCMTCREDCGPCAPTCGDGTCGSGETCTSCPTDCGPCPAVCGDGACNGTETCATCSRDCSECPPRCGDGACNGSDTCTSCPADCGPCPANCAAIGSCAACTTNPACGWCPVEGACQAGNASGPTGTSLCSIFGGWVRSASSCTAPDSGVRDSGVVDSGATNNLTRACVTGENDDGLDAECGWSLAQTYTCTPGAAVVIGCTGTLPSDSGACMGRVGSCSGDPVIRVCAGSSARCSYPTRVVTTAGYSEDDACGTCPLGRFVCPASGALTVYSRRYYIDQAATCTVGRL